MNYSSEILFSSISKELNTPKFFMERFNKIPSIFICESIPIEASEGFFKNYDSKLIWDYDNASKNNHYKYKIIELIDLDILVSFYYSVEKNTSFSSLEVYYDSKSKEIDKITSTLLDLKRKVITNNNRINLIISNDNLLDSTRFNLPPQSVDIELHYGKKFLPIYDKIVDKLKKPNEKGLVLFHGEPGTGKTTLVKYLSTQLDKDIFFIPQTLVHSLASPALLPFFFNNKNSILVIEDAEKVLGARENAGSANYVSTILNLTDGILGDCLNLQIIATINTKKEKLDEALLRKGRLIAEYEFKRLDVQESNNLLNHLSKKYVTDTPMTLAEIFNLEDKLIRKEREESVGFSNIKYTVTTSNKEV